MNEIKRLQELAGIKNENTKAFKLKITNKNGTSTTQIVHADPESTELFNIIANLKKSKNIKDVNVIEDENEE